MNWETANFDVENMDVLETSEDSLCIPVRPGHVLMPNFRTFTDLAAVCNKFHGRSSVVTTKELQDELVNTAIQAADVCACKGKKLGHFQTKLRINSIICTSTLIFTS